MNNTVEIFKALADETRLRILSLLLNEGELCVCDIIDSLKLPQSTVSRHLAYLRKSGWVGDRRCGVWMYYSLDSATVTRHQLLVDFLREKLKDLPPLDLDRERIRKSGKGNQCG